MTTFITPMEPGSGDGPRLAVKDLIDVAGVPTTAGSRAVAEGAAPAVSDAPCMVGARAAGARVVGKANLFELAFGASGVNEWFGTPANPLDPGLLPGGSSSGSAVAVATGQADVAFGSDTGGSIRVPSAFCGTTGLKTTWGRVPVEGVWPLAVSLDTVGPMARDVAGVALGMALLEPGFAPEAAPPRMVGRLRAPGVDVDPVIDAAVDAALRAAGFEVVELAVPGWPDAAAATLAILEAEAVTANRHLLDDPARAALLGESVYRRLRIALAITPGQVRAARQHQPVWQAELRVLFDRVEVLALPTVGFFPPPVAEAGRWHFTGLTNPLNLAGFPALAQPVVAAGPLPASLQLVGPAGAEARLLAAGAVIEAAAAPESG